MKLRTIPSTPVQVANRYHLRGEAITRSVSVQRPGPLGNRWKAQEVGRETALANYRKWLDEEFHRRDGEAYRELMRLAWIDPLTITCTCLPRECHAQIVAEYIERLRKELRTVREDMETTDDGSF